MSVAELIEQIKALPPHELAAVRDFLNRESESSDSPQSVRYATDEEFDRATDRVFENHDELLRKLAE